MTGALHNGREYVGSRTMIRCDGELSRAAETEARDAVLLVEDEVIVRMMMADKLRDAGYAVIEASNACEALEVLRHNSVDVRLILSDIRMPGAMDGISLAREVRSRYPAIKVVLTSGHLAAVDRAEHDGFFPKPYDAATIIRHIKTLLG
jgi:two-component system, response regulator PdtaR